MAAASVIEEVYESNEKVVLTTIRPHLLDVPRGFEAAAPLMRCAIGGEGSRWRP
jgi:hypothetical protein